MAEAGWRGTTRRVSGKQQSGWPEVICCSFCGKSRDRVSGIVLGPTPRIAICNECIELAAEILREPSGQPSEPPSSASRP